MFFLLQITQAHLFTHSIRYFHITHQHTPHPKLLLPALIYLSKLILYLYYCACVPSFPSDSRPPFLLLKQGLIPKTPLLPTLARHPGSNIKASCALPRALGWEINAPQIRTQPRDQLPGLKTTKKSCLEPLMSPQCYIYHEVMG